MPIGMTFTDISAVLNQINKLATHTQTDNNIVDTSSFVSVAESTLRTGYDNYMGAISQVLTNTLFAVRQYGAIAPGLRMTPAAYGNHVRKINFFDTDALPDKAWALTDGESVDQWEVHKPVQLQTNYYGQTNYSRCLSRPTDQLNAAFRGPDQFAEWLSATLLHMSNQIAQDNQGLRLNLLANLAGGITKTSPNSVVYLLDEYNAKTGKTLTAANVFAPENYPDFARYAYGRIADMSDLLTARTINWHQNWTISGKTYNFARHTPYNMQRLYLYSGEQRQIQARVLSDTFNPALLSYGDYQTLPFFQRPDNGERNTISVKPIYTGNDGTATISADNVQIANVFGILADVDAVGYSPILETVEASPYNARGRYTNLWYHYNYRWYNDFTENSVLFVLTAGDITHPNAAAKASMLKSSTTKDPAPVE